MSKCDYCQHVEMCGWRKSLEERGCDFFDDGNRWIPVSERLPECLEDVLTCNNGGFVEIQNFEVPNGYWADRHGDGTDFDEVVAWMPLPEPYKAESEDI